MDRLSPTRRPAGRPAMRQRWAELLFLHWSFSPGTLARLIPAGLDVDTFEGRAYVGLVAFTMSGVRPVWAPAVPGLSSFHETNVRTYVHVDGRDPGVFFFSLDAASRVAVAVARTLWKLPYHFARMSLRREEAEVAYRFDRRWPGPVPADGGFRYCPAGAPRPAEPGTLDHFLVERYILYTPSRGRLYSGRVHHPPYPLQAAEVGQLSESLLAAAGIERPEAPPLAHYAREVDVEVFSLERLTP